MTHQLSPKCLATEQEQPLLHIQDADCTLDDYGVCIYCGVLHGEPCVHCGGAGFHKPGCLTRHELWSAIKRGERVAWFVLDNHRNSEGKLLGLLAHEHHTGFYITDLQLNSDLGIAQYECDQHNEALGLEFTEAPVIVLSTFTG